MLKLIKWLGNELRENATLAAIIGAVIGALIGYVLNSNSSTLWQIIWVILGVIIGGSLGLTSIYSFYRYFKESQYSSKSHNDVSINDNETTNREFTSKTQSRWVRSPITKSRWRKR